MVDTVTTNTIFNGDRRLVVNILSASDGTGEAAVAKVTAASFTGPNSPEPTTHFVVEEINYDIQGFAHVDLYFDATSDSPLAKLSGQGYIDYRESGGLVDPQATGTTGNVVLTTVGATATATYNITISLRKKN